MSRHLLNQTIEVITPRFSQAITQGTNEQERSILAAIEETNAGLQLFSGLGLFKNHAFCISERRPIYRLYSPAHDTEIVFLLESCKGELSALVFLLFTATKRQGSYFRLKDFGLRVLRVLFGSGCSKVEGDAAFNDSPVRNRERDFRRERTREGKPKLVRLYELLGFTRTVGNNVQMSRDDYSRAVEGARSDFERGGVIPATAAPLAA